MSETRLEVDNPEALKYVRSHTEQLPLKLGLLPKVPLCRGPTPSTTEKGMDSVCCANCDIIRVCYYNHQGVSVEGKEALRYVINLINHNQKILSGLTVSVCNETVIHYTPAKHFAEHALFRECLKAQCTSMAEMMLVDYGIIAKNVKNHLICDSDGMPYIIPSPKLTKLSHFGGDEGVEIDDDMVRVVDREKMLKSGKWAHVLLYYIVFDFITGRNSTLRLW